MTPLKGVVDLSPIAEHTEIDHLVPHRAEAFANLDAPAALTGLTRPHLSQGQPLAGLGFLAHLAGLQDPVERTLLRRRPGAAGAVDEPGLDDLGQGVDVHWL